MGRNEFTMLIYSFYTITQYRNQIYWGMEWQTYQIEHIWKNIFWCLQNNEIIINDNQSLLIHLNTRGQKISCCETPIQWACRSSFELNPLTYGTFHRRHEVNGTEIAHQAFKSYYDHTSLRSGSWECEGRRPRRSSGFSLLLDAYGTWQTIFAGVHFSISMLLLNTSFLTPLSKVKSHPDLLIQHRGL